MKRHPYRFNSDGLDDVEELNLDNDTKCIGDRVKVIGNAPSLSCEQKLNDVVIYNCSFNSDDYFIVIEINQKIKSPIFDYTQDLIIVNPKTNIKYRISSVHVKLL